MLLPYRTILLKKEQCDMRNEGTYLVTSGEKVNDPF